MIYCIGNTPMIRLRKIEKAFNTKGRIFGKAELLNPAGSIKDRVALALIKKYEAVGALKVGSTLIEATSGNTGIALAMIGALRGYRVKITMPEGASSERINLIKSYGAEVFLTDRAQGMSGAITLAEAMHENIRDSIMTDQFNNTAGVAAHYRETAPEIWRDMNGNIDVFVCGVGTGATLVGIGKYLRLFSSAEIIAVEPSESAVLSGNSRGLHGIDGIGAGFIPPLFNSKYVDKIETVSTEDASEMTSFLAKSEGILAGISTGSNLAVAINAAKAKDVNVVMPLCDRGERYFSRRIFALD